MIESILTIVLGIGVVASLLLPIGKTDKPKGKTKGRISDIREGNRGETIFVVRFSDNGEEHICPSLPYRGITDRDYAIGEDVDVEYSYVSLFGRKVYTLWLSDAAPGNSFNRKMILIVGAGIIAFGAVTLCIGLFGK